MSGRTPIDISGFTVYRDVDPSDDQFNVFLNATLVFRGINVLTDDAITGAGLARNSGQTTIDDSLTLDDSVTFANAGTVTQNNANLIIGLTSSDAATVRNVGGATWDLVGDEQITGASGSQFINRGLLEQTGSGAAIDAQFYDRGGTIQVDGTLGFAFGAPAARFVDDTIEGPGTFSFFNGTLDGSNVSTSLVEMQFGRIVGDVTISSARFFGGSIVSFATGAVLSLTGSAAVVEFGSISGGGEIDFKGDDSVYSPQGGNGVSGEMKLVNFGDTTFNGIIVGDIPGFVITADGQTVIENHVGATWTDLGDETEFKSDGGTASFINNGTFIQNTIEGVSFAINVVNNDIMEIGPNFDTNLGADSLLFSDALSGSGTIELGASNVDTEGSVGAGQQFQFSPVASGETSSLTIGDLLEFAGTIVDFGENGAPGNQLIVKQPDGWQFQEFAPNSGGTGGSLMFSNGSAETAVNLTGTYDPLGFHAAVSGSTTTITYTG
jgi:hypothetical protein